ncbi:hypothetical protein ICN11_08385 [Polynucleobacter sp. 78F-HAINBA]|uniref:hypothetical protein n=1 Tax=Polynucleobacter sp. 78F-HAINBA TaxID=2689099 RepID=UPI001C0DC25B|nr:hypothetical protein [Polynucleobacter sp. 78F-HAINBA]MBU3592032.1 hypothetical protein [Polynucleobacter sp. 78F-HAINBA]
MNPETKNSVWLSFWRSLKGGVCTSYRSDAAIIDDEPWPEITSALSIEGLLFKPTVRDQYLLRRRPIINELFANHITNLRIYGSSNPILELEDEDSKIFRFDHAGKQFETGIIWSIDDPLTLSRILNDVRSANFVTASIELLCSDSFFDLSDPKFAETDEYEELEVHQHEINIKRIDLVFK